MLAILVASCAVLAAGLVAAGWWAENRLLGRDIPLGEDGAVLRVHGADFEWWALNLSADSVWYRSPALDARAGATAFRVDFIGGVLAMRPAVRLDVDSVWLRLRAGTTDPEREPVALDSIAFPAFSVPVAVRADVQGVRVEDDSGVVVQARDIALRVPGGRTLGVRAGGVQTRWTGDRNIGGGARLDWSAADSVDLDARFGAGRDTLRLQARHAQAPLWRGRDSLSLDVNDPGPWLAGLGIDTTTLPAIRSVRLRGRTEWSPGGSFALRLEARTDAWEASPDFSLGPQRVTLQAAWNGGPGGNGTLALASSGAAPVREDIRLDATVRLLPDADTAAPLHERAALTVSGHARNLLVNVRDTLRSADLVIREASWDGAALALDVVTGDSSRVRARGTLAGPASRHRARFEADIAPEERFVRIFTGDAVSFTGLSARGAYDGTTVTAEVDVRGLRAYDFALDSLHTVHAYVLPAGGRGGEYRLYPSRLHDGRATWTLSARVRPPVRAGEGVAVEATLANPRHGRLAYALEPDGSMEAVATGFAATALPYAPLDALPVRDGVLDGRFAWNPARNSGAADLRARVTYTGANGTGKGQAEEIRARVDASWDAQRMNLRRAAVHYRGSELGIAARARLDGRPFHALHEVPPTGYEFLRIESNRFDLADILKAVLPEHPLDRGVVRGALEYSADSGFAGTLTLEDPALREPPAGLALGNVELRGRGDTLEVRASSTSGEVPVLNLSARALLSGMTRDRQHVRLDVVSDSLLTLRAEAALQEFASPRGTLALKGDVRLSGQDSAAALRNVDARLEFSAPAQGGLAAATLSTQTFTGEIELPNQPRQRFSLDPQFVSGVFSVPTLVVENDQGQRLAGRVEVAPETGTLRAHAEGPRFALQWMDAWRADVRDLRLDVDAGAGGLRVATSFASGSFSYADLPLRVEGRLSNVRVNYIRPARANAARSNLPADTLRASAVLQGSEVRYRLRNFGDIQRLVGRSERRRPTVGAPLLLDVKVRTTGSDNRINSDILRLAWVGDLAVRGIHPYTLLEGRVNTLEGDFGLEREAYAINRLDLKWLNAPPEEGEVHMEARKQLARSCQARNDDETCTVIARLDGLLRTMQFSYDSDCGGAFGAGANVAAILYSVQRGCYDASITTGDGRGYGERAFTLLEPTISRSLTQLMGPVWGAWIETAEVSGLGSLSPDAAASDTLGEALSLALTSREYRRFRIKVRSGYHLNSQDLSSQTESMLALEWRIPLPDALRDSTWRLRLDNNLRAAASVETRPVRRGSLEKDEVERKIGLFYNYAWWGDWWGRKEENAE